MFCKGFCITAGLMSNYGGIHIIEDRNNQIPGFHAFKNVNKLIQAPPGRSIVFRQNNNGNLEFWIACKSFGDISFPLSSSSSSLKVTIPFRMRSVYRWSVKLLRVSPLKLRKASYSNPESDEEKDEEERCDWYVEKLWCLNFPLP